MYSFPNFEPCLVLVVAFWPAYRFHRRKVRWSGIPISFKIFHSLLFICSLKCLPLCYFHIHHFKPLHTKPFLIIQASSDLSLLIICILNILPLSDVLILPSQVYFKYLWRQKFDLYFFCVLLQAFTHLVSSWGSPYCTDRVSSHAFDAKMSKIYFRSLLFP